VWFDTNPNPTTLVVNNATTGNYTTSVGVSTQTYYYKAQAWNSTGGYSANSSVQNWTFDRVSPSLTIQPNNEFNLQNYSRRNPFDHVLNLNLTVGDDHALYGFSVNVTRTGTVYFNYSNETLTGTQYNYTASVDTTTWPVGRYDVNIQASDSHTKNAIKDYVVTKAQSKLRFQTDEGNDISIETDDPASVDAVKDNDRYSFEFSYNGKGSKARTFHVKSATPIVYLPSSSYKAHFIVKNGVQGNWIDFEGVTGTPIVTKVTENHYVVRFDNLPDKLAFHSIGGLNVLDANYSFYNGNYSLQNPSPVFTGEAIVLGLNMTNDASSITSIMANLTYNGTVYAPSATNDSVLYQFTQARTNPNVTATIAYNWTLNVTEGDGYSMLFNISASHSIQDWGIISCGSPAFINWTQYDEDTPANLNAGTFQVGLTYWVGNKSNAKTYNATYALASSWSLCFTPVDANFTANIYAQNTVMGGFTHRFYIQNANYSNSTTFYKLYSPLNTSLSAYSDLTITTRQSTDYKYFKNVYAQLQRFYIGTGTWLTVQYDKSGDFGLLFFDVKEQSVDYRLLYYNENNTLLKQTDSLKFVCTSGVCELTQLLDPAASGVTAATVTSSLSFNNATGILSVNWTGSSTTASTVVIKIVKLATTTTSICSTTQTGNAGSFTCNATGYTGTLYATVDADGKPNAATYFDVPRASIGSLISPAFSSLITFILMLTIIGFGLFSPMGLVIAVILSLVVVYWIGIFTPITVTFLIISAVIGFVISIKVKQ
jgi:hypothetical protein